MKIEEFIPIDDNTFEEISSGGLITMGKTEIIKFITYKK